MSLEKYIFILIFLKFFHFRHSWENFCGNLSEICISLFFGILKNFNIFLKFFDFVQNNEKYFFTIIIFSKNFAKIKSQKWEIIIQKYLVLCSDLCFVLLFPCW